MRKFERDEENSDGWRVCVTFVFGDDGGFTWQDARSSYGGEALWTCSGRFEQTGDQLTLHVVKLSRTWEGGTQVGQVLRARETPEGLVIDGVYSGTLQRIS